MKKEQETENNKTEEKKGDMRKEVVSWVRMFVIVIAVVFVLTQFVIINVRVHGKYDHDQGSSDWLPFFLLV